MSGQRSQQQPAGIRWHTGLVAFLAVVLANLGAVSAGEEANLGDAGAPWVEMRQRCAAIRETYRTTVEALHARVGDRLKTEAGMVEFRTGRKAAGEAFHAALRKEAGTAVTVGAGVAWHPAYGLLGQELLEFGDHGAAMAAYEQALLPPWKPEAKPAQFKAWLTQLDGLAPEQRKYLNHHQAWCCYRLATLCERSGRAKEAVALYEHGLRLERRPRYLFALALAQMLHAEFEKARLLLAEASQVTGAKNVLIEYQFGYCLEKLWLLEEAHAAYTRSAAAAAAANAAGAPPPLKPAAPDGLGWVAEPAGPVQWDLEVAPYVIDQALQRVKTVQGNLSAGQKDAVRKAYRLFKQASELDLSATLEKTPGLTVEQADFEQGKLFNQYEGLISQAVVTFPRLVPAVVQAGLIKLNRKEPEQALTLFQTALEADRDDPAALIFFAQTSLRLAGRDLELLQRALPPPTPPAGGGAPPVPPQPPVTLSQEQAVALLAEADRWLQPLPDLGKRLARLLDKHAIGFEISALAQYEQVHANAFRRAPVPRAESKLLELAYQDYLRARGRGGASIDLFETRRPHDANSRLERPDSTPTEGTPPHGPVRNP